LDGYVVSSMLFRILKTISPSILDGTEVIHTGFIIVGTLEHVLTAIRHHL
jgi:hypothetical protein